MSKRTRRKTKLSEEQAVSLKVDTDESPVSCSSAAVDAPRQASRKDAARSGRETMPSVSERFDVTEILGEGGMSFVYKAVDKEEGRVFAVKVLKSSGDSSRAASFAREIEAASQLDHPNLVAIYESGTSLDQRPFALMDYVDGPSLAEVLSKEVFVEQERALDLFMQIGEGLSYAHSRGIVHLDLKPSNVLINQSSSAEIAKIVDFGIARIMTDNAKELATTDEIVGSLLYMSPEQCKGDAVDSRSDIYSFGCLMYEVLTGRAPLVGENPVKTIMKQLHETPRRFSAAFKRLDISPSLETIVMHCLEKNPKERYQFVEELLKDLELAKSGREPLVALQQKQSSSKRNHISHEQKLTVAALGATILCIWGFHLSKFDTFMQLAMIWWTLCCTGGLAVMCILAKYLLEQWNLVHSRLQDKETTMPGDAWLRATLVLATVPIAAITGILVLTLLDNNNINLLGESLSSHLNTMGVTVQYWAALFLAATAVIPFMIWARVRFFSRPAAERS